jgi:signal transduction histidine kinase/FixJ family two-component response regulator
MSSPRSFKTYSTILWYCDSGNARQDLVDTLKQEGFEVELAFSEEELKEKYRTVTPSFFIIDHPQNIERGIQLVVSGKRHAKDSVFTSILISDHISCEDKDKYFQAGGEEILLAPVSSSELLFKVKHYQSQHKSKAEFNFQLEEASQMALLAMENSSDLGGILSFVKEAMYAKDYEELAEKIFHATHLYCNAAIVEIKGHENSHFFSSTGQIDPDMKRFLISQKNEGRIVESESIIQVNNKNLVVLLEGIPSDDPEKMGRISDTLVMLCDTANRFAESIATEENLSTSEESRRKFLSTLSHELRTPLNGVLGFSKTLKGRGEETPLGKSGLDALGRIVESTDQINAIITTLIDISSVSMGTQELSKNNFKLSSLASKLETSFSDIACKKGLIFEVDTPDELTMYGNEKKIYSMLHHLVDNAVKFTDSGSVKVTINTDHDTSTGQRIVFKVSDTGIGIDSKDHIRIFTEVGQLNNEHNRAHYGVGLGLYYVNLLSQQFNGKISVVSEPGKGSTFTLDLPSGEVIEEKEADSNNQQQEIDDLLF